MASYYRLIDLASDLLYEEGNFRKPVWSTWIQVCSTVATAQG